MPEVAPSTASAIPLAVALRTMLPAPPRPATVPESAEWNAEADAWQLGEFRGTSPVGPQITWRRDGSLRTRGDYDDQGRAHGLHQRYHPPASDGEPPLLASEARYEHGLLHGKQTWTRPPRGSPENRDFPLANLSLWQIEMLYVKGEPAGGVTLYTRSGSRAPVPVQADGRSEELGRHLGKILPGTALVVVADFVDVVGAERLPHLADATLTYHGPALGRTASSAPVHRVRIVPTEGPEQIVMVEPSEFSRAFSLAVDLGAARLVRGEAPTGAHRPATPTSNLPFRVDATRKRLNLANRNLEQVPPEIGQLHGLEELRLDGNDLTELPRELVNLTRLRRLDLGGNLRLERLPPALFSLTSLEHLECAESGLRELPAAVGNLTELTFLGLAHTVVTRIPPEIGRLTALVDLVLVGTPVTELPPEIGRLHALRTLDASYTQLSSLPRAVGKLTALEELSVSSPNLVHLPLDLFRLRNLRKLALSGCELEALSDDIGQLTQLRALYLTGSHLDVLPESLFSLPRLETLVFFGAPLTTLPRAIAGLRSLKTMALYDVPIASASAEIAKLAHLTDLTLSGHALDAKSKRALRELLPHCTITFSDGRAKGG